MLTSCMKTEPDIYGSIYGFVTDAETSHPIPAAEVTLSPTGKTAVTGDDGRYEFINLEAGQYSIQVKKSRFQTNKKSLTVNPGSVTQADVVLQIENGSLYIENPQINYGTSANQSILNISNRGGNSLEWNITKDCEWVSEIIPSTGTIPANSSTSVLVKIDRNKLSDSQIAETTLIVSSNGRNVEIAISVNKTSGQNPPIAITDGLLTYYNFDDNSIIDLSGYGNNGRTVNSPEFISDAPNGKGKCLSLKAAKNEYLVIPANPLAKTEIYTTLHEYSVSFWIKDFESGMIFSLINTHETSSLPYFYTQNDSFFIEIKENGLSEVINLGQGASSYKDGIWHMITYTTNKGVQELYIDSKKFSEKNAIYYNYQLIAKNSIHFGGDGGFSNYRKPMNMKIDNIRIHNKQLTSEEVTIIYNAEK
ncbi:concanavalin A-like lectin/glucanase superfamily protein [Dysgonomonas alginatilytica]|uniref:Concanavalin A-like lectin/glucanase superfamily protein n=2 Tax=Dysgonomonas alginatilytica TaxID=1605892 RepID=A0A2V3PHR8_9BACT|nr:concanavalin A-like lectin/glucanase superfamily protein [Dysgonomonas alginatilytica]